MKVLSFPLLVHPERTRTFETTKKITLKVHLNTSIRAHLVLGLVISIWLVLFLVFIGPFDIAELPMKYRLELMPGYGVIFLVCYMLVVLLQNWIFQRVGKWNLLLELGIITLLYVLVLCGNFLYYRSSWINGEMNFGQFLGLIYLPTLLVISVLFLFGRWFISRKQTEMESNVEPSNFSKKIILKGDNRSDVLQLGSKDLVCISSAQNYVEVFFLQNKVLQKKLLRTTLKKIAQDAPEMVQVHRSHLINPDHFVQWSGQNSIHVHELEIPVSKNYRDRLDKLI